jgi:hypothetical protein
LAVALRLPATSIDTKFEGGSLGAVQRVSTTHYRLALIGDKDQDGRNRQADWYYFRVDQPPREELLLDLVDLPGEYNYTPNRGAVTADTPAVISFDNKTWTHVENFKYDATEPKMRLRIKSNGKSFWIAHTPPYTNETLARLRSQIRGNPAFHEEIIGQSVRKRNLFLWTITAPGPIAGRKTVWLFFRQHSWESGSSWAGEGAIRTLLDGGEQSSRMRREIVWKIIPICDPDGLARGSVRFNVNGYDLNRNWDVDNRELMPEITAQRNAVGRWIEAGHGIDLLFSLHNTETAEYLEGTPGNALAQRFFDHLTKDTTFFPSRPLSTAASTTTPGKEGRMTVIQGLYHRYKIPGFLMEQRISYNEKLNRRPLIEDRVRFGGELVRAIWKTVI